MSWSKKALHTLGSEGQGWQGPFPTLSDTLAKGPLVVGVNVEDVTNEGWELGRDLGGVDGGVPMSHVDYKKR